MKITYDIDEPLKCGLCKEVYYPNDLRPKDEFTLKRIVVNHWFMKHENFFIERAASMLHSYHEGN
jgi:hypothetical protein